MNNDKIAAALARSRTDIGRSQEYMAKAVGVSRRTVQNWEDGYSSPSVSYLLDWFNVLGLQPLPYILDTIYPEFTGVKSDASDEAVEAALMSLVDSLPIDLKRKLLYILFGNHGSSPSAVIEMATAHLHAPLRDRINIAHGILNNYEMAREMGTDVQPGHIQPELSVFKAAIYNARASVLNNSAGYSISKEEYDESRTPAIGKLPRPEND